jgi:hypothetical protein
MNKNNINFQVHRTKESTLVELLCGLLMLISLILSIILFFNVRQAGVGMLVQTGAVGLGVLLMLFFAYKPETFNIPDDSPARLFLVTVRFLRYAAVLISLMSLGMTLSVVLGFTPTVVAASSALLFVPLLCWYFYEYMKVKRNKMRE